MGTISSALDRPVRTAAVIGTEDEAIHVARTVAGLFDLSSPAASGTAETRLDLLSRSGLFGISVPTEQGGIDVSNTVLVAVCAEAASHSATLGEILAAHFTALEHIRSFGTEGQRNTIFAAARSGARLARAVARRGGAELEALPLAIVGLAHRLSGEALSTPCTRHADWMLIPVLGDGGKTAGLLLPTRIDGLRYAANSCEPAPGGVQPAEPVLFKDVLIDGDVLLHAAGEAPQPPVPHALDLLLEASRHLGAGRRALRQVLEGATAPATIGLLSARLAAAEAMAEEAGRAIDAAQIGLAGQHRTNAFLAATAALTVAQEAASAIRQADSVGMEKTEQTLSAASRAALEQSGRLLIEMHRHAPEAET